jgi:hypothetical protein
LAAALSAKRSCDHIEKPIRKNLGLKIELGIFSCLANATATRDRVRSFFWSGPKVQLVANKIVFGIGHRMSLM